MEVASDNNLTLLDTLHSKEAIVGGKMNNKTRRFTYLTLFVTIEIVLSVVPFLGYIPLGFINATTLHIPVILAAIILGKQEGAIVGGVFGLTSLIKNTMTPNATSFLFSPFFSVAGVNGNFGSLVIAILPRILMGFIAGLLFEILAKKMKANQSAAIASFLGSFINTILVMAGAYFFFKEAYANAVGVAISSLGTFILTVVFTNGLVESILAAIICPFVYKATKRSIRKG